MPTIDATPGGAASNSYATIAEADAYHDERPWSAATWAQAAADAKARALITATRLLDDHFAWVGAVSSSTQALAWPRDGASSRNGASYASDAIPPPIRDATSDLAGRLIAATSDPTSENRAETQGLTSLEVGDVALTFRTDRTIRAEVWALLHAISPMISHLGKLHWISLNRPVGRV